MPACTKVFILFVSVFMASCQLGIPTKTQVLNLYSAPNLRTEEGHYTHLGLFKLGDWPSLRWWQQFNDPELNQLVDIALQQNLTLKEMERRVSSARQIAVVTRANLFPLIFFNANETTQYLSKNGLYRALNPNLPLHANLLDLSLSFTYEVDFWGKNRNLFRQALGDAKAQEAETAQAVLVTTTTLSQAYFAYKTNCLRQKLYQELLNLRQSLKSLHSALLHHGLESKLPYLNAAEAVLEAEKLLGDLREELSNNIYLINVLLGRNPNTPLNLSAQLPIVPKKLMLPERLGLDLISRRPDLLAQIWRAKALAYRVGAAMADYYPDINLLGFIGLESVFFKKIFDISSGKGGISPAVHLPIFTAGAIKANIQARKAEFDAAIFAYNELLLRSTQEVLATLVYAQTVFQHQQEQQHIVHLATERLNLVQLNQRSGLNSEISVYDLRETLIQKQLTQLNFLYNQYVAVIKLNKALGGGYSQASIPLVANNEIKFNK